VTESSNDLPGVLIYTPHLLAAIQHYVRQHAVQLQRYRPVFSGRRRVEGISIDDFPVFTFEDNSFARLRELRFLLTSRDAALKAFVQRHRIKLIHAHFGPGGTEIMPLAAWLGIPLIVTFHGWDVKLGEEIRNPMSLYERLYRRRLPRLFQPSNTIVCVSENWRERVIELGCPPDIAHTNYLGVDTAFFDGARGEFNPMSILFVGRLVRRKGVHVLLEALRILRDRGVAANLTVVGEGPESRRLRTTADSSNLPVRFLGRKNHAEIRELLRQTAVFCAPSLTTGGEVPEALGLVLLEAAAMGVPVIGTRNGGIPETMEDGNTGYLVDQDSAPSLADGLARLVGNEELNRVFGQRARSFICGRFDIARCYRSLEAIYDRILERSRTASCRNA
jgi:colanic acid/amylovoran biosynthesis glycosyltransferase